MIDGEIYAIPWDWGYSSLVYRGDKVQPEEESWNLILDERYKGRIGFFSDGVAIIKVGGLINGVADPNKMTQDEIDAAKETMIRAKPQHPHLLDVADRRHQGGRGRQPRHHVRLAGRLLHDPRRAAGRASVTYMQPKEGRLAWVCAYVLHKDTQPRRRSRTR